tara:strand:- start:57 stop:290 length:234 start_codon:yes stop_codon:yes gene_type:complete
MAHTGKIGELLGRKKGWKKRDDISAEAAHELAKHGKKQKTFFSDTGESSGKGHRILDNKESRERWKKEKRPKGGWTN